MKLTAILDILGLVFVVLKLTGVIATWSWLQVCIPFIVNAAILVVSVIVQIIAAAIANR